MKTVLLPMATGQGISYDRLSDEINETMEGARVVLVPGMTGNAIIVDDEPAPLETRPTNTTTNTRKRK